MITSNAIWKALEITINTMTTDDLSKKQVCIGPGKLVQIETQKKAFTDDTEVASTTLLAEKRQGQPMVPEDIILGGRKRYLPKTMAKKVTITEEATEDNDIPELLRPSQRLLASAYKTQDIDVAGLVIQSTAVVGGYDNVVLASTAHVLPTGGTESNYLNGGVGMTPSVHALIQAAAMGALLKGPNGIIDGVTIKLIVCPEIQRYLWQAIIGSDQLPGTNFNDLNVVKDMKLGLLPIKWLDASSTTQWGLKTDADNGFRCLMRRKVRSTTWSDPDGEAAHHGVSYRMSLGHSNWRVWIQGSV